MRQANRALKALPENLRLDIEEVASVTAFQVARAAAAAIPIGVGRDVTTYKNVKGGGRRGTTQRGFHLRNVVTSKRVKGGAVVGVPADAFYWKFLEYGTTRGARGTKTPRRKRTALQLASRKTGIAARGMFRKAGDAARAGHYAKLMQALRKLDARTERAGFGGGLT